MDSMEGDLADLVISWSLDDIFDAERYRDQVLFFGLLAFFKKNFVVDVFIVVTLMIFFFFCG